jgi:hypothetical protein
LLPNGVTFWCRSGWLRFFREVFVVAEWVECGDCGVLVQGQLVEATLAAQVRESAGFFVVEPHPVRLPLRNQMRLCQPCGSKLFAVADGPWEISEEEVADAAERITAADA